MEDTIKISLTQQQKELIVKALRAVVEMFEDEEQDTIYEVIDKLEQ